MTQEPSKWVYAIGRVEVRFTHESVQREYQQALKGERTSNQTEGQVLYNTLKKNRYLARAALWVFQVEKLDTYILEPEDPYDFDLLVEAIKPRADDEIDTDVVVGALGGFPPSAESGGITAPVVIFDQLYSFTKKELIDAIPKPRDMAEGAFRSTSNELVDRIQLMADNVGATDEHRAINYLAVRYPSLYAHSTQMHANDSSLTEIGVIGSRFTGTRNLKNVIFTYVNRKTDVTEKYRVRVDVTGEFPFLDTAISPYFDIM